MKDCIAVVDVETTGLSPWRHDRVIEIGVLVLDADGTVREEYETLVNPERDIGPTRIHGISAGDVLHAPRFADIAGDILYLLRGARVLAGHNVSFDRNFLIKEFERLDTVLPDMPLLCTCRLMGRQKLSVCCQELGIEIDASVGEFHSALYDAHATAEILRRLMGEDPALLASVPRTPLEWPSLRRKRASPMRRAAARNQPVKPPDFLQRITENCVYDTDDHSPDVLTYLALLDRVLEDRIIDRDEEDALVDAARELSLSKPEVLSAHQTYLQNLAAQAWADGIVTEAERRDLVTVCNLLGIDSIQLDSILEHTRKHLADTKIAIPANDSLAGQSVCFTGELLSSIDGEPLTRPIAQALAAAAGMKISNGVTKKLDILVVADPNSQSTKAKKARDYGTRIIAEPVFWRIIGVSVDQYS